MSFTTRTVRNKWHEVEGVLTKYVHSDDETTETLDLTDYVAAPAGAVAGIASAVFADVSGVVLGAITTVGMFLSWLVQKTGVATLTVQFQTTVPESELVVGDGVQAASVTTSTGGAPEVDSVVGDEVMVEFSTEDAPDEHLGRYLRVTSGADTCLMLLHESLLASGPEYGCTVYGATLLEDLPDSLNGSYSEGYEPTLVWSFVEPAVTTLGDVVNIHMQWVDPSSSDTDYTP